MCARRRARCPAISEPSRGRWKGVRPVKDQYIASVDQGTASSRCLIFDRRGRLDAIPGLEEQAQAGEVLFGTIDSWLIYNLTGRHVTDVTNAGRTMLMNLRTLDWEDELLAAIGVPRAILPEIVPSTEIYGEA